MPIDGALIAAALGIGKSELIDRPAAERQRKLLAQTQRYSPWTGMKGNAVQEANPFGTALQFGAAGASMGAGYDKAKLDSAAADSLKAGTPASPDPGALAVANNSGPASMGAGAGNGGVLGGKGGQWYDSNNPYANYTGGNPWTNMRSQQVD